MIPKQVWRKKISSIVTTTEYNRVVYIFLIHICVHLDTLNNNLYFHSELSIVHMYGIQHSLVNIVWDTASTGSCGGTVFPLGGTLFTSE